MLALAAAIALQNTDLPDKASVDFSGIPVVTGANLAIESHTATLTIFKDHVDVSTLTLVKNNGAAGQAAVMIPRWHVGKSDAPVAFHPTATWAGAPLTLLGLSNPSASESSTATGRFDGSGAMKNLGTYALRINYTVPIGHCSLTHDQRLVAYDLSSPAPIGTLMVSYKYAQEKTFDEPVCGPNLGWQAGMRGAFVKVNGYDGKTGVSYAAFYSGWFNTGGG